MARIAVLGPGGVGGLLAAALERSGQDVTVVAREETADAISARGISVQSVVLGTFTAHPPAAPTLAHPVDFLIVATKATGLEEALGRVQAEPRVVVPLLNGLEHMDRLRARFGEDRVIAGVIRVESDRPAPGEVVQTSPAIRVDLATERPALAEAVRELSTAIEQAGIAVQRGDSERQVLWSKLARLNALALTTSASDRPIGFVRADPRWRSALEGAVFETVAVANADGAVLDAGNTLAELDQAHGELGSSMQRDIAAGREPELDAIAGAVLRAGARQGIRCPTVTWLVGQVVKRADVPAPSP